MRKFLFASTITLLLLAISLNSSIFVYSSPVAHMMRLPLQKVALDAPLATPQIGNLITSNAAVPGGVPFCKSGGGTIICLSPAFLKKAYDFPAKLDGTGSTIVLIDAFGDPYIQNDLNLFSSTFGIPTTTVTVLCPPSFTGALTDQCAPLSDFTNPTPGSRADLCGAGGWGTESVLDVTMAHGLAPGAKIILVEAASCFDDDLNAAEAAVVSQPSLKGSIMSQSFGEPDDQVDPAIRAQADATYALARANGWTVMASSGDWGANTDIIDLGTTELTPSWPSTNPNNLAIGGTQGNPDGGQYHFGFGVTPKIDTCAAGATCNIGLVIINGGANGCTTTPRPGPATSCVPTGYGAEGAWNEFIPRGTIGLVTGGGISSYYARPAYQAGLPNTFKTLLGSSVSAAGFRLVPDVAFNSVTNGGVLSPFFTGSGLTSPLADGTAVCSGNSSPNCPVWYVFGGTSASSPAWAAIIALANQANGKPVGFISPAIYNLGMGNNQGNQQGNPFHDIRVGNNSVTAGLFGIDGFKAGPGYDLTTGWGTPDVAVFIPSLISELNQNQQ